MFRAWHFPSYNPFPLSILSEAKYQAPMHILLCFPISLIALRAYFYQTCCNVRIREITSYFHSLPMLEDSPHPSRRDYSSRSGRAKANPLLVICSSKGFAVLQRLFPIPILVNTHSHPGHLWTKAGPVPSSASVVLVLLLPRRYLETHFYTLYSDIWSRRQAKIVKLLAAAAVPYGKQTVSLTTLHQSELHHLQCSNPATLFP